MLSNILNFADEAEEALRLGAYFTEIMEGTSQVRDRMARSKYISEDNLDKIKALAGQVKEDIHQVLAKGGI